MAMLRLPRSRCHDGYATMFTSCHRHRTFAIVTSCHRHRNIVPSPVRMLTQHDGTMMILRCYNGDDYDCDATVAMSTMARCHEGNGTMLRWRCHDGTMLNDGVIAIVPWKSCYRHRAIAIVPWCHRTIAIVAIAIDGIAIVAYAMAASPS